MKRLITFRSLVAALVLLTPFTLASAAKAQYVQPTAFTTGSYSTLTFRTLSASSSANVPAAHGEILLYKNGNPYIGLLVFETLDGAGNVMITVSGRTANGGWLTISKVVPDTQANRTYWIQDYTRGIVRLLGGPLPDVSIGTFWADNIDPALYDTTH